MTSGQWPVNQCYCLTSLYKPLLLHISFSARGWQWRCLIRGSRLTWPRRQSTSREWRGECPVFRNGWLLWMRQVNVETLEFGFRAAMNECRCSSSRKFVMKVLNCVLLDIGSVLIEFYDCLKLDRKQSCSCGFRGWNPADIWILNSVATCREDLAMCYQPQCGSRAWSFPRATLDLIVLHPMGFDLTW